MSTGHQRLKLIPPSVGHRGDVWKGDDGRLWMCTTSSEDLGQILESCFIIRARWRRVRPWERIRWHLAGIRP